MSDCKCPRIDGYVIRRQSCPHHPSRPAITEAEVVAIEPEDEDLACAWADYRKDFGVGRDQMTAARKAFKAGWKAAREGDQSGALR